MKKISKIIDSLGNAIDKNFTTQDEKNAALIELKRLELEAMQVENDFMTQILQKENERLGAESESFLKRNWRPFLFSGLSVGLLVNWVFFPFFGKMPIDWPDPLWNLINYGVGGYTTLLGIEKVVKSVKGTNIISKKDKE